MAKFKKLKIDNDWLLKEFKMLNERFFGWALHHMDVGFADLPKTEKGTKINGRWNPTRRTIEISKEFIPLGTDCITITLLHEMAHAHLEQHREYRGYPCDGGHGTLFQGEICRLMKAGAYDGLL